ncbi:MAG: FAD-binding oxidoreductase [Alphaproteobacteria bacterium]|jgi:glycine/D-amino acid oxidase-like deaminating enzyme|nr:FAD-binding oxidoreductase [Alphaproteobacteria bacterium]
MAHPLFHPDFKPEPYWWEAARPSTDGSMPMPEAIDVLIVGSGYAGLATALELQRNGRSAWVVERDAFGEGASSRNGGAVSASVNLGKGLGGAAGQKSDQGELDRFVAEGKDVLDLLEGLIEREGIDCHYERSGRFVGAYAAHHYNDLAAKAAALNRLGDAGAEALPPERQREEIGSDFYHGGLVVRRAGKLHPALYHQGLLAACAKAGVGLSAETEVTNIQGRPGAFTVTTSAGQTRAEEVVIATNGYTAKVTQNLRRRLIPVASHIIATEELPDDLARALSPNGRTLSETPRILHYFRLSPDGRRMIFGGRARFTDVGPEVSAPLLHAAMTARFPELKEARITHSWRGNVAFTFDHVPHMGQDDGMHYALGCNGSGVAMLTYLGHQVARRILGGGNIDSVYDGRPFPTMPFYTGRPWFLPLAGAWFRRLDRRERRRGR